MTTMIMMNDPKKKIYFFIISYSAEMMIDNEILLNKY